MEMKTETKLNISPYFWYFYLSVGVSFRASAGPSAFSKLIMTSTVDSHISWHSKIYGYATNLFNNLQRLTIR
jgi:hypothetical protein